MWEMLPDDDDPDAVGELGSGDYCADHFAAVVSQKQSTGFDVTHQWHDSDWGQGCETCAAQDSP